MLAEKLLRFLKTYCDVFCRLLAQSFIRSSEKRLFGEPLEAQ